MAEVNTDDTPVRGTSAVTDRDDSSFDMPADDPRRTENRGGLDAIIHTAPDPVPHATGSHVTEGPANLGTTDADLSQTGHDVGASGSGVADSGQVDLSTTGMADPDAGPAGAGPVEGSRSGVVGPRVEVSDVGLVDLNSADMSAPGEGDDNASVPSDTQS